MDRDTKGSCKPEMQSVRHPHNPKPTRHHGYTNGNVANGCGKRPPGAGGGGGAGGGTGAGGGAAGGGGGGIGGGGMASATQPPYRAAWGPAPAPAGPPPPLRYPPPPYAPSHAPPLHPHTHPHPHAPPLHTLPPLHAAAHSQYASSGRVPTAASPSNTTSSSSSATGSQSGTMSTSLSNNANAPSEQLSRTNLYIRGLSHTTTDKDLVNMCHQYGTIISTKAILDKNTNKCKGYGFVDFESVGSAEAAVKGLQAKGIQAQMAKVGIWLLHRPNSQQEQDPTNLYMANLPPHYKENDVDQLLARFGQVISTRILRDTYGHSKGVGFARMESRDKCEKIIQVFNGNPLEGAKEPLLVKFADGGGNKKKQYKNTDRTWRDNQDPTHQNVGTVGPAMYGCNPGADLGMFRSGVYVGSYPVSSWLPPYPILQPTHIPAHPIDPEQYAVPVGRGDRMGLVLPDATQQYPTQLLSHVGTLQLVPPQYIATTHPYGYMGSAGPSLLHAIEPDHSTAASPDEPYQPYPPK